MERLLRVACVCLLTWTEVTSSGENVVVKEGSDVILPCSPSTKENLVVKLFDWKKDGRQEVFLYDAGIHYNNGRPGQDPQFKGRVSHFTGELKHGNASIMIRDTKVADSGDYTCEFPRLQPSETFHIKLTVGAAPEPSITTLNQTQNWSLLQCVVRDASPKPEVQWQDSSGNSLPAEEKFTKKGDSYDVNLQTTVTKTGFYRCVATQKEFNHRIHAETYVHITGAAPEPSVTTRKTNEGVLLQCVVRGASPKPKVEWRDSSGNILPAKEQVTERGGSFDIILQTDVTKTDNFRCVVTQEGSDYQTHAETYATPNEETHSKLITGIGIGIGVVVGIIGTLAVVGIVLYLKSRSGGSNAAPASGDKAENESQPLEQSPH